MAPAYIVVALAVLAAFQFVLFGALLELFKDVRQLRDAAGLLDRPLEMQIGPVAGASPSSYGLPAALDGAASALVLFLSDRCLACRTLASSLNGVLPPKLWVIVEAGTKEAARAFLDVFKLQEDIDEGRVIIDVNGGIAARIGLDTTPVGFRVKSGTFVNATTVPSVRYLHSIIRSEAADQSENGNPN